MISGFFKLNIFWKDLGINEYLSGSSFKIDKSLRMVKATTRSLYVITIPCPGFEGL
jgi:hypothetical protein